jgi:hypothetical protein
MTLTFDLKLFAQAKLLTKQRETKISGRALRLFDLLFFSE